MSCDSYHLELETLPSLNDNNIVFQNVISHLRECPQCLDHYYATQRLDVLLANKLNELILPPSFISQLRDHLRKSIMPHLRQAILKEIKNTASHPKASWIFKQIEQLFPQTSFRSFSRHLSILKNDGHILELDFGEGFKRFDGNIKSHCHFICQKCKNICDIQKPPRHIINLEEIQTLGYELFDFKLELLGICNKCKEV
jgi:Fur family peroxide stress response transcriptional regulator